MSPASGGERRSSAAAQQNAFCAKGLGDTGDDPPNHSGDGIRRWPDSDVRLIRRHARFANFGFDGH
jgi:hypothetical protein